MIDLPIGLESQFCGPAAELIPWIEHPSVTDIFVNGTVSAYMERGGENHPIPNPFKTQEQLNGFLERLLVPLGKRVDATRPYTDGTLAQGHRFHLILPPLVDPGPALSIRTVKAAGRLSLESFASGGAAETLQRWVTERRNILISGATGSGKTSLLRQLLMLAGAHERIVVIEEAPEIRLSSQQFLQLLARQPNPDGKGGVSLADLVRNSLRMRPDRLVVGECRGPEAVDFLQAMSTGHSGCMGTVHAHGAREALHRMEILCLMSGLRMGPAALRNWIASSIGGVIQLARGHGGRRDVVEMAEVKGCEGEVFRLLPIELESPSISGSLLGASK